MKKRTEVIARGVLLHSERVLLCRSVSGGYSYLPGGHIEFAEPSRTALEREFIEETGLAVRATDLIGASEGTFTVGGRTHHEINLLFHVELRGRHRARVLPVVASRENDIAFDWVPVNRVGRLDLRPKAARTFLASLHRNGAPSKADFRTDFE